MTKVHKPTEKSKKQLDQKKNATKNFDYTIIADRVMTVSWSSDSHPTGIVKPVYGTYSDLFFFVLALYISVAIIHKCCKRNLTWNI